MTLLIPVPKTLPAAQNPDRNVLIALNGRTGAELWRLELKPATINPLAAADLDGDGQPEIVAQVGNRLATFDNRTGANHWASQGSDPLRGVAYERDLTAAGVSIADLDSDGTLEIATILEGDPETGTPASELLVVSAVDGAEEWRQTITGDAASGGPLIADVDGDDDLLEIVVGTGFFTVTDSEAHTGKVFVYEPNAADLVVDSVTVIGNGIVNEPQTVRATVRNAGTRDVTGAAFRLADAGAPVGADQTVNLAAGASATLDFGWTPATFGNHSLRVTGDPANVVRELNEENNDRTVTFRVKVRPTANFTFSPSSPDETATVQFTDTSTDPDGSIAARAWSCSDGFTSSAANPTHKFADGATYSCTLTVTDNDGLTDGETKSVTVSHVAPVAGFTQDDDGTGVVQFTDQSTHPNGPDAPPTGWAYAWDFDNDGTVDSTARNPQHDFGSSPSSSTVKLAVTDNDGQTDDIVRTLRWPLADYSFSPASPNETQTVQLTDTSTDPDGSIAARAWSCSDGFTSSATNPSHKFADGGSYTCDLRVSDNHNLDDTTTKTITVAHVPPAADFDVEVIEPGQVQFTDTSTHANAADAPPTGWTYAWDFEDDGTVDSTARNPFHDYGVEEGEFDIRLRTTDNDGQVDEVVTTIDVGLINQPPTANLAYSPLRPRAGEEMTFTDLSNDPDGQIVKIEVEWGDGTPNTVKTGTDVAGSRLKHTYVEGHRDYRIIWTVTDNRGATDWSPRGVHVCQPPFELDLELGHIRFQACPEPIQI
ncbi:MAG: PKD domain-containing protein [Actinobacteria bacterium]|nr:PKD domain-containing protein [Actinomycetota bacterium]